VQPQLGNRTDLASDDFSACALDSRWEVIDPQGVGDASLTTGSTGDAELSLRLPGGAVHDAWGGDGNTALRAMQHLSTEPGDLELEVKFDSEPTGGYSDQGVLIEQDQATYLRFDVFHGGGKLTVFGGRTAGGTNIAAFSATIVSGAARHMRVTRSGDQFTLWISADGASWTRVGTTTQRLAVEAVGVYAANPVTGGEFTAHVDYMFNATTPIVPEDGTTVSCERLD